MNDLPYPHPVKPFGRRAVVYDMNGREAEEAELILDVLPDLEQYIFCSSAGVYLKSDQMPHREEDAVDHKSRHKVAHRLLLPVLYMCAAHSCLD